MTINTLRLSSFRNYDTLSVDLDPHVVVLRGDNAQGKTNFLEAASFFATMRSFRGAKDREMVMMDRPRAYIGAGVLRNDREYLLEAEFYPAARRRLYVNKVRQKSAAAILGIAPSVVFSSDDLELIRGGAQVRRRFMDATLSQMRPRYMTALSQYGRLHEHKTRILRDGQEKPSLYDTLDDFNEKLAQNGAVLIKYRDELCQKLDEESRDVHLEASSGLERLELRYKTVTETEGAREDEGFLYRALCDQQKRLREAEMSAGTCLSGPHKDDFEVTINGSDVKRFGSQGQTRTASLSLKLSQRTILYREFGEMPVLFLDDVLSELDRHRQHFVLEKISSGQVIITCCQPELPESVQNAQYLWVENGKIINS